MFDIVHIILMGLLNLVIGLFIGFLIGGWDFKEKKKTPSQVVNENNKLGELLKENKNLKKNTKKQKDLKYKKKSYTKRSLTRSQRDVLNAIDLFIDEYGYSPTYKEICDILGYSSTGTVGAIVKILKRKKYVTCIPYGSRTIKIIKK